MGIFQGRSNRKATGGRLRDFRKVRESELGKVPTLSKIGPRRVKVERVLGGHLKLRLMSEDIVNLLDPKTKKFEKVKIKIVVENPGNRHYVRRNIMTKGTIIETEKGKARITNRPGQEGMINAVLIS